MPTTPVLVVPLDVLATAAVVDQCGSAARGCRGEVHALGLTGGCGGVAATAFARMSASWLAELARLTEQAIALAGLLRSSAADYASTDQGAFGPAGGSAAPAASGEQP